MSLQNMNQMWLVPKKDYVANRLVSGALQLARNTFLFLDETHLEQGQLDTTGERTKHCEYKQSGYCAACRHCKYDVTELTLTRLDLLLCVFVM